MRAGVTHTARSTHPIFRDTGPRAIWCIYCGVGPHTDSCKQLWLNWILQLCHVSLLWSLRYSDRMCCNERNVNVRALVRTHTRARGDNILSFGNHRLTQTGLVSQSRSLCLEKLISKLFHCQDAWTPHFSLLNETPCNFNSTYPVKKACWNKCHTVTIDIHRTGRDSSFITSLLMF